MLSFRADHEARDVVQEHDRSVLLVAQANELGSLVRLLAINDGQLVSYETDWHTLAKVSG